LRSHQAICPEVAKLYNCYGRIKRKILQSRQLKTVNMKTTNTYRTQRYTPYSHENQSKQRLIKGLEQEVEKWKTEAEQSKSEMKVWEEAFHLQIQQTEKA